MRRRRYCKQNWLNWEEAGDEYAPVGEEENVGGATGGGEEEEDSDKSDVESSGRR